MDKPARLLALARTIAADPTFQAVWSAGKGDRAPVEFMRQLRVAARGEFDIDHSERRICGENALLVGFYFPEEATIVEVALDLPNPASQFENDVLKALMAKEAGTEVRRLFFISRPGAIKKCDQPGRAAVKAWAASKHGLQIEVHELGVTTLKPLDRGGIMMYTSEVRELLDSLRYRIHVMRQARDKWVQHHELTTAQAGALADDFDTDAFAVALNATVQHQTTIFDLFDSFLAAWARLSLLFHPTGGKNDMAAWRVRRGELLRGVTALPDDTLLAKRTFRDSWMHMDERLDAAFVGGWLGYRHQFVPTAMVPAVLANSLLVIDIEALTFHYRDRDGAQHNVTIDDIAQCLELLVTDIKGDAVGKRMVKLIPMPNP
jgi:hypothetical protein